MLMMELVGQTMQMDHELYLILDLLIRMLHEYTLLPIIKQIALAM